MDELLSEEGATRIDLLGGTLDLHPIDLLIPDAVVINMAIPLKARVSLRRHSAKKVILHSKDYGLSREFPSDDFTPAKLRSDHFGPLVFAAHILHHFEVREGVELTLQSDSPAGAGLGGSSAMGAALYKLLCRFTKRDFAEAQAVRVLKDIEGGVLGRGPAGWQDYYPALYGGVLALAATPGEILVERFDEKQVGEALKSRVLLVDSGERRLSAANNWELYKNFFDDRGNAREGLGTIAALAARARMALREGRFADLPELIAQEGELRERLFPGILSEGMKQLKSHLPSGTGMKVCGAGGGGCFLLICRPDERAAISEAVTGAKMRLLAWAP